MPHVEGTLTSSLINESMGPDEFSDVLIWRSGPPNLQAFGPYPRSARLEKKETGSNMCIDVPYTIIIIFIIKRRKCERCWCIIEAPAF